MEHKILVTSLNNKMISPENNTKDLNLHFRIYSKSSIIKSNNSALYQLQGQQALTSKTVDF